VRLAKWQAVDYPRVAWQRVLGNFHMITTARSTGSRERGMTTTNVDTSLKSNIQNYMGPRLGMISLAAEYFLDWVNVFQPGTGKRAGAL